VAGIGTKNPVIRAFGTLKRATFPRKNRWPSRVLETLESTYHLRPYEMLRLWFVEENLARGKYRNSSLLIYDREKAREKNIVVRDSSDLNANSDLLVFRGNRFGDGTVKLRKVNNIGNN